MAAMRSSGLAVRVAIAGIWLSGCGDDDRPGRPIDAGGSPDAGGVGMDAGPSARDAGPDFDGRPFGIDAGAALPDAPVGVDAGVASDAGCVAPYSCPAYPAPRVEWVSDYSGGPAYVGGIAIDSTGGAVAAGTYAGAIDLGSGPLAVSSTRAMFIARVNADGSPDWAMRVVTSDGDVGMNDVAVDASDNVFAAGYGRGSLDFGAGPVPAPPGFRPGFVAKLDPDGVVIWVRRFGELSVGSVVVDAMGRPFALGTFNGTIDLGTAGTFTSGAGGADQLLLALDASDGAVRFARQLGEVDSVDPSGVLAIGPADDMWVAGPFWSGSGGEYGIWIERLDPMGTRRWRRREVAPAMPLPEVFDLAVGAASEPVMLGSGALDFGGGALTGNTWVVRLGSAAGTYRWSDQTLAPQRLAVDETDRIWVGGNWTGVAVTIRPEPCGFSGADYGSYLLELDATGARVGFGAFFHGGTLAMAARAGRVVVGGNSFMEIDLGCGRRMSDFEELFLTSLTR